MSNVTFKASKRAIFFYFITLLNLQFFFGTSLNAQVIATYPMVSAGGFNFNYNPALSNPNITALPMQVGSELESNAPNNTAWRIKNLKNHPSKLWPFEPTDNYHFQYPVYPKLGYDFNLTSISFTIKQIENGPIDLMILPRFQVNGTGPWYDLSAPINITGGTASGLNIPVTINTNETFYSGNGPTANTYIIRFYVYGNTASDDDDEGFRFSPMVFNGTVYSPTALPVTVTTVSATATGKYSGTVTGTYSYEAANPNKYYLVKQSGVIYSTSEAELATMDTSAKTKTTNGGAGVINSNITGLNAATQYWAKTYIVTQFGIQYGAVRSFTTLAPTPPSVTTNPVSGVLSNKATGSGTVTDGGGVPVSAVGFVWNSNGGATLASNSGRVILNGATGNFTDFMKGLAPSTQYCYRAFATNALGTTYGDDVCFTTGAPEPVLVAIPGVIDFGEVYFGSNPITVTYNLTGQNLTPATGTITVSVPVASGFRISLNSSTGYGNSITIPYTGGTLPRTPIFVRLPTGTFGNFTGVITHSGGGVTAVNADVVNLTGQVLPSPDDITNRGTDFWLGFAYQNRMNQAPTSNNKPYLTVYVAAGNQPATVNVQTPGIPGAYNQTQTVPANSTRAFTTFPDGLVPGQDTRLFATGISNKAIRVTSTNGAPISVWMYIATTGNSAGGAMIFPTETWNSNYVVQAYAGKSNNGLPNSNFFIIAAEDDTKITITPSSGIISPAGALVDNPPVQYPANVPFTITLNKGQIFNAVGVITGSSGGASSSGFDLSGTTITTDCDKKIAVFGGNGRCMVTTPVNCTESNVSSGSDNMVQQMIPSVAWDTKYFTVPTKTMEYNLFRVYVRDANQKVWINDPTHGNTLLTTPGAKSGAPRYNGYYVFTKFANSPGGYYAVETNTPLEIESDEPISVTQFITAGDCGDKPAIGNNGQGDPEMIILTGAQQAITNAVVYSPAFQNNASGAGYINVVIKKEGVETFRLNPTTNPTQMVDTGRSSFAGGQQYQAGALLPIKEAFKPYPTNPNYYWAKFRVAYPATHVMSSTVPFNAIAYGVASGESYGFNAGTAVKNLSSYKISVNPEGTDSSSTVVRTCVNLPITLKIAFPYNPTLVDSVVWEPNDARITPNARIVGPIVAGKAEYEGTVDVNGRTFYIYKAPVEYTFALQALYRFKVTAYGTFASDCPGEDQEIILVNVGQDNLNLAANPACNNPLVPFTADTIPMVGTNILSWEWDFGDGTKLSTGNITPQSHTYPTGGATEYKVKLTTKNTVGCISTDSLLVDFGGGLEAFFTPSTKAACANTNVSFTEASYGTGTSGAPSSWEWDFGDGKTFNGQNPPPQSWATPGQKIVALTVRTPIGCVKTYTDTITVEATPVPAIDAPADICIGTAVSYKDNSTVAIGTITEWLWSFDDGTTSTLQNPNHTWNTPGNHVTTLSVKSAGGCPSITDATHTISIIPPPTAGFSYDLNCTTREISVTDTSNAQGSTISKWNWDFGDGTTASTQNPKHVYATAGTYTVTLSVETVNGCASTAPASKQITIDVSPVADFVLPGNTCLPNATPVFTNASTISDGTIATVTYQWEFGDGGTSTLKDPTHVYTNTGNYDVRLTAISAKGCTNSTVKTYSAIFARPVAAIGTIAEVCAGGTASFSSAGSTAPGSAIAGWTWDFGDGATSTQQNPTHTYAAAGNYTVSLIVSSGAGCTSAAVTATAVVNALPVADFTSVANCTTREVTFTDASTSAAGTVNAWAWAFGDTKTSTQQNPTNQYANEGSFTVTLTVTTDKGCTSSTAASKTVTIAAAPVANFDLPGNLCLPTASGTFTNTTTISDGTLAQVSYAWEFGDGGTSTATNPVHAYTAVGPYTIKLTATSNQGCVNSTSKTYNGVYTQPVAVITAPAGVCLGNNTNFSSAQSTAPASTVSGWQWNFGDGGTSTDQNPVYIYAAGGNKTVTLVVTSAVGCSSAPVTQSFDVNLSPVPNFTFSNIRCADSVITFTDASVSNAAGGITEWSWNFGDGTTLTQTTAGPVTHTFSTAQSFTVSLALKNANNCLSAAAYSVPVVIHPNPVSNFTASAICIPAGTAQFTQQATISSGSITSWDWDFGNGLTGTGAAPATTYATGGEYQVTLKATSNQGCAAIFTAPVKAYNTPTPLFSINTTGALCSNLPVSIKDQSVVNGYGDVDKIEIFWDYLNAPNAKDVINAPGVNTDYPHTFAEFGTPATRTYRVLVRATSGVGCSADYFEDVVMLAAPKVQFNQLAAVCQEAASFNLAGASDQFNLPGSGAYSGSGVTTSPEFSPETAGAGTHTIRYTYTTLTGCTDFAERTIVVDPTPVIDFGGTELNVLEGDVMKLSPSISNGATFLWTPGTYLNSTTIASPSGKPVNDITYNLKATSTFGCFSEKSIYVRVVRNYIVPNTFTPNGDQIHDRWEIENLVYYPAVRVRVFNRSGQMVFESLGYNTPWDGNYKGKPLPFGTYYYVIETGGGRQPRTGYVTILK
ncbi:MAG TPA: PKD domain-containing protein [Ferruginibacter sp.]|nr:PKD domain-containing protein [Ferruginibacter sp.]HMP20561.1 PKD domain-containing protein [Ferruginibacter sp.]